MTTRLPGNRIDSETQTLRHSASEESVDWELLGRFSEMSATLLHEFADFLNLLLLQVAVLERKIAIEDRRDLEEVSRQARQVAQLVECLQATPRPRPLLTDRIDLTQLTREVVEQLSTEKNITLCQISPARLPEQILPEQILPEQILPEQILPEQIKNGIAVHIHEAAGNGEIVGARLETRRLLYFLLSNAIRAAGNGSKIVAVKIEPGPKGIQFSVEDGGSPLSEAECAYLFDPSRNVRSESNRLEMAACRSLARKMGAALTGERSEKGTALMTVIFPGTEQPK